MKARSSGKHSALGVVAAAALTMQLAGLPAVADVDIGSASITPWRNNAKAAYSIVHDDICSGATSGVPAGDPPNWRIGPNLNLRLAWAGIGRDCRDNAGSISMLADMIAAGQEVASHSFAHCNHTLPETDIPPQDSEASPYCPQEYPGLGNFAFTESEMFGSKTWFDANVPGANITFYAFPFDAYNPVGGFDPQLLDRLRLSPAGYLGARGGSRGVFNESFIDPEGSPNVDFALAFDAYGGAGSSASIWPHPSYESYLTYVEGNSGWGIQELHNIGNSGYGYVTPSEYTSFLTDVAARQNNPPGTRLWVAPPTDVIKYRRSRYHCGSRSGGYGLMTINGLELSFPGADPLSSDYTACGKYATPVTVSATINGTVSALGATQAGTWIAVETAATLPSAGPFWFTANPVGGPITLLSSAQSPAITSAASATFRSGDSGTFTVTKTGTPTPTLSMAGALPVGLAFDSTTGVLAGTPSQSGTFPITYTANNGVYPGPTASQSFSLVVLPDTTISTSTPTVTNSASATFNFGGGSTYECSFNNGPYVSCTSPVAFSDLGSGSYSFAVRATSGLLDQTPATFAWTVDLVPPTISINSPAPITQGNQSGYTVAGACSEPDRAVTVQIGSIDVTPKPVCASGAFSTAAIDVSGLGPGPVDLSASITDTAGNAASASASTVKDTTGPSLTIGTLDLINKANQANYGFAGACEAGGGDVGYTLASGGSVSGQVPCTSGSYVVVNVNVSTLTDGTVAFTVTQLDALGNVGTGAGSVAKDTASPLVTIDAPALINGGNQTDYDVTGTCSENGRIVSVSIGTLNTTASCGGGGVGIFQAKGLNVSAQSEGSLLISASMTDLAGNSGTANAMTSKDTTPEVQLVADANPSQIGQTVTFTATLVGYADPPYSPTGTVTFRSGGTAITTCRQGVVDPLVPIESAGVYALCFVTYSGGGTFLITAEYSGDSRYKASVSPVYTQSVGFKGQTITFPTLPDRILGEASFAVSATASSGLPVSFSSTTPSTCTTGDANGATVTLVAAGTCSIAADQAGDAEFAPAPQVVRSFAVQKASPGIVLASSANPVGLAVPVTFTATLASAQSLTGTVAFRVAGNAIAGCETASLTTVIGGAYATCTISTLSTGTHSITAVYSGDNLHASVTSDALGQLVNVLAQTISFAPLSARTYGELAFAVAATASPSGLPVTFSSLTPTVCSTSGTNGFLVSLNGAGTCTIAANQAGDSSYGAAPQVTRSFAVAKATPGLTLQSDANPASYGQAVTFTATLATLSQAPGGTIAFRNGAAAIVGCEGKSLTPVSGGAFAVCTTVNLPGGTNIVAATYSGDANYTPLTSAAVNQVVNAPLGASTSSIAFGGQSMNTTSPPRTVIITNSGSAVITVTSVTVNGTFSVDHNCGELLAAGTCTANVRFTPTGDAEFTGTLTASSSAGVTTVSLTGTGERSLVTHYYQSILRRQPDAGGKGFWEGEATRARALGLNVNEVWYAMAQAFYFSPEYLAFGRSDASFVTDLYNTFFNRTPDAGGITFWMLLLAQGMPREVVLTSFMFSQEFANFTRAIFGNTAVRAEIDTVTDFYRGLLSRLPDDGGFAYWLARFRAAQCLGGNAVNAEVESISSLFTGSQEYTNRARNDSQYVGDLYNAFLRRGGDLNGVQYWILQISSGLRSRDNVRQAFVASPEFQARVAAIIAQGCLQ